MCFVCSLCFAGVHNDAIPICAYGVVLYWEHGEGDTCMLAKAKQDLLK